jgi:hypothetical protein
MATKTKRTAAASGAKKTTTASSKTSSKTASKAPAKGPAKSPAKASAKPANKPPKELKLATVDAYLAALPDDRRQALDAVRKVILKNLDRDFEEGIQYGMIGYYVPHRVFPAGYHCDPRQPLPFAALGSQKNYMSLHLMCTYSDSELSTWFREAWAKTGKKLDMGKACVRFKRIEEVALDVVGQLIKRVSAKAYIAHMQTLVAGRRK